MPSMILIGDVNLMNVTDPAVPFARMAEEMRAADLVFANLECCLYQPPGAHAVEREGFFADPDIAGEALRIGGIAAVGLANNVNTAPPRSPDRSRSSTGSGLPMPGRAAISPRRGRRRSSRQTGSESALSSAARSTGRPTTRRASTTAVSRSSPPHRLPGARAQDPPRDAADEPARHPARYPDLGGPRLPGRLCRRTSPICATKPISSSPRAIGGWAKRCSTIWARSPTPRSMPAPTS